MSNEQSTGSADDKAHVSPSASPAKASPTAGGVTALGVPCTFEPITFRISLLAGRANSRSEYQGFIVPDTDRLLVIDKRYCDDEDGEAVWWITHLPTGMRVSWYPETEAHTKERAAQIAQQFYRQYVGRGWSLAGTDPDAIAKHVRDLPPKQKAAFWAAVAAR